MILATANDVSPASHTVHILTYEPDYVVLIPTEPLPSSPS